MIFWSMIDVAHAESYVINAFELNGSWSNYSNQGLALAQSNGSTYGKVARRGVRKTAAQRNRNTATAPVHSQKPKCQNTECRSALWIGVAQEGSSRVRSNKDSLKKIPTNGNSVTNDQIQNNCAANRLRPRPFHAHQQLHNIPIARKPAAERPRSSWSRRTPKTS